MQEENKILEYYLPIYYQFKNKIIDENKFLNIEIHTKDEFVFNFLMETKKFVSEKGFYDGRIEHNLFKIDPSFAFSTLKNSPLLNYFYNYIDLKLEDIENNYFQTNNKNLLIETEIDNLILKQEKYIKEFFGMFLVKKLYKNRVDDTNRKIHLFCKYFKFFNLYLSKDEFERVKSLSLEEINKAFEDLKTFKTFNGFVSVQHQKQNLFNKEESLLSNQKASLNSINNIDNILNTNDKKLTINDNVNITNQNPTNNINKEEENNKSLKSLKQVDFSSIVSTNSENSIVNNSNQKTNENKNLKQETKVEKNKQVKDPQEKTTKNLNNIQDLTLNELIKLGGQPDGLEFEKRFVDFLNFEYLSFYSKRKRRNKTKDLLSLFTGRTEKGLENIVKYIEEEKKQNKEKVIEVCEYKSFNSLSEKEKAIYKEEDKIYELPKDKYLKEDLEFPLILKTHKIIQKDLPIYQAVHNPHSDNLEFKATKKDVVISYPYSILEPNKKGKNEIELSLKMSNDNNSLKLFGGYNKIFLNFLLNLPFLNRYKKTNKAILETLLYLLFEIDLEEEYKQKNLMFSENILDVFSKEEYEELLDENTGKMAFKNLLNKKQQIKTFDKYIQMLIDFLSSNAKNITQYFFKGEDKVKWFVFYYRKKETLYIHNIDSILSSNKIKESAFNKITLLENGFDIGDIIKVRNDLRSIKKNGLKDFVTAELKYNKMKELSPPKKEMLQIKF